MNGFHYTDNFYTFPYLFYNLRVQDCCLWSPAGPERNCDTISVWKLQECLPEMVIWDTKNEVIVVITLL